MSVSIPVGFGLLSWSFNASFGTPPFVATIGVSLSNAGGDYVATCNQALGAWTTTLAEITDSDISCDFVSLAIGQDGGEAASVRSSDAGANGERSGASVPISTGAIMQKITATPGRRGRGRATFPGLLGQDDVDLSGVLSASRQANLSSRFLNFITQVSTGYTGQPADDVQQNQLFLLHSAEADLAPSALSGVVCAPKVGVLRKRLR